MINLNGNVLRNLEEQVQYLTEQLNALKTLNLNGLTIVGNVQDVSQIPEDYTGNIGDCYIVVNAPQPNDLYMYGDIGGGNIGWLYLGPYPVRGPQGNNGLKGPKGDTGQSTKWYTGIEFPSGAKIGDMFLKTDTYQVYRFDENAGWVSKCNIKGLSGKDGLNGNSIYDIESYHSNATNKTIITIKTTQGGITQVDIPDGKNGTGFHIEHVYPDDVEGASELTTLPNNIVELIEAEWPAADAQTSDATLVKTTEDGDYIFCIIKENSQQVWDNVGEIASVQGPQGDPGPQGVSITNVAVNSSNHLIVTFSDGTTSDAGEIDVSGSEDIYPAIYGTSTYQEVMTAYNAGKLVVCNYGVSGFSNAVFTISGINSTYGIIFSMNYKPGSTSSHTGAGFMYYLYLSEQDVWTNESKAVESTANKAFSLSSASTNVEYPSAKCVYDALTAKMEDPLTAMGDMVYAGADVSPMALAIGNPGDTLRVNASGTGPAWVDAGYGVKVLTGTISSANLYTLVKNIIQSSWTTLGFNKIISLDIMPASSVSYSNIYQRSITIPQSGNLTVSSTTGTLSGQWLTQNTMSHFVVGGQQSYVTTTLPTTFHFTRIFGTESDIKCMRMQMSVAQVSFTIGSCVLPTFGSSPTSTTWNLARGSQSVTHANMPTLTYKLTYIEDGNTFTIPT